MTEQLAGRSRRNGGFHLRHSPLNWGTSEWPHWSGDYEGYVDAHFRQLEAPRRAGILARVNADQWRIPDDLVSHATTYDGGRDRTASVRVLSSVDLGRQIGAEGSTWPGRRLIHGDSGDLAPTGFG